MTQCPGPRQWKSQHLRRRQLTRHRNQASKQRSTSPRHQLTRSTTQHRRDQRPARQDAAIAMQRRASRWYLSRRWRPQLSRRLWNRKLHVAAHRVLGGHAQPPLSPCNSSRPRMSARAKGRKRARRSRNSVRGPRSCNSKSPARSSGTLSFGLPTPDSAHSAMITKTLYLTELSR